MKSICYGCDHFRPERGEIGALCAKGGYQGPGNEDCLYSTTKVPVEKVSESHLAKFFKTKSCRDCVYFLPPSAGDPMDCVLAEDMTRPGECENYCSRHYTPELDMAPSRHKKPSTTKSSVCKICGGDLSPYSWIPGRDRGLCSNCWKKVARKLDRFYQANPKQAINDFRYEYDRGKALAPLFLQIINHLIDLWKQGAPLFIHGRDGEMVYQLLKRVGVRKGVGYGLSSRSITTQAAPADREKTLAILSRVCQKGAIHFDTGFAGSIPKWMDQQGFCVSDIQMVYARNPQYQIPGLLGTHIKALFPDSWVETNLETCPQRLRSFNYWGEVQYDEEAGGFWARLYGICDATGLSRTVLRERIGASKEEIAFYNRKARIPLKATIGEMVGK